MTKAGTQAPQTHTIRQDDTRYPPQLIQRMGVTAPPAIYAMGTLDLLESHKTAFFCSSRTPGSAILLAHDMARTLRDEGRFVISGFHSPIEKECMPILLRGNQPIIICQARAMESMHFPTECRSAFQAGRLLFLSPFTELPKRVTRESALRRNEMVAALADEVIFAHIALGSHLEALAQQMAAWGIPVKILI
jgi:predicted Rossmann fold nucleotide-binding protein DprA/Smf involved in DNA uptake